MNPDHMHQHGKELMAIGYNHIVAIDNYHAEIGPKRYFVNKAMEFQFDTPVAEYDAELTMILIKNPKFDDVILEYKGHKCICCIQDGELRSTGIYVFFKTSEGAIKCAKTYGNII